MSNEVINAADKIGAWLRELVLHNKTFIQEQFVVTWIRRCSLSISLLCIQKNYETRRPSETYHTADDNVGLDFRSSGSQCVTGFGRAIVVRRQFQSNLTIICYFKIMPRRNIESLFDISKYRRSVIDCGFVISE